MRIVLVSDYYAPHVGGGVERVVEEVARRLVGLDHEVRVVTFNPNGYPPVEVRDGVEVVRIPALNLQPILGMPAMFNASLSLSKHLAGADVIHTHNLFFLLSLLTVAARPRAPIVTTMHLGSLDHLPGATGALARAYEKSLGRYILRRSAAVSGVSGAVASHARWLGANGKVRVIPNTVDVERFHPVPNGENGHVNVLFLGRLSRNKGPQFLVEAIPKIVSAVPNVRFHFVGEGPLRRSLVRRIESLRLNGTVHLEGRVPDVVPVLQHSDIVVRPSLTEGMPLAVMEAMACGKAIVASRVAGTPDIIQHHETGILVEPGDVRSLTRGLLELVSDPARAEALGRRAREWTEQQMTWDSITRQYLSMYEEVAA